MEGLGARRGEGPPPEPRVRRPERARRPRQRPPRGRDGGCRGLLQRRRRHCCPRGRPWHRRGRPTPRREDLLRQGIEQRRVGSGGGGAPSRIADGAHDRLGSRPGLWDGPRARRRSRSGPVGCPGWQRLRRAVLRRQGRVGAADPGPAPAAERSRVDRGGQGAAGACAARKRGARPRLRPAAGRTSDSRSALGRRRPGRLPAFR